MYGVAVGGGATLCGAWPLGWGGATGDTGATLGGTELLSVAL